MSETIKLEPTMQRNEYDVAMELTRAYWANSRQSEKSAEEIQDTFAKFYAMAKGLSLMNPKDLSKLVDNPEIAQILNEYQ